MKTKHTKDDAMSSIAWQIIGLVVALALISSGVTFTNDSVEKF